MLITSYLEQFFSISLLLALQYLRPTQPDGFYPKMSMLALYLKTINETPGDKASKLLLLTTVLFSECLRHDVNKPNSLFHLGLFTTIFIPLICTLPTVLSTFVFPDGIMSDDFYTNKFQPLEKKAMQHVTVVAIMAGILTQDVRHLAASTCYLGVSILSSESTGGNRHTESKLIAIAAGILTTLSHPSQAVFYLAFPFFSAIGSVMSTPPTQTPRP